MDLLETTLKVIENRNASREHLTVFKENLNQYNDYINTMKENLEDTLLKNSHNKEILEINNFTKDAFNENCKRVKDLFGTVYNYTQQIQGRLATIMDQEASLEETYSENEERCGLLDTKYNNSLKLLVILEKDSVEKLAKERSDIEDNFNKINEEFTTLSQSWNKTIDERNEKYKTSQATILEVEILQDNLQTRQEEEDLYMKTMQETKEKNQKLVDEVAKDIEAMDDQLLEIEKDIAAILHTELKEYMKNKEKMLHDQNQTLMKFEELSRDYSNTEKFITEIENTSSTITEKLSAEIASRKNLLAKNEQELLLCNAKAMDVSNENDQMRSKISALSVDFESMKIQFETLQQAKQDILRKIAEVEEENELLINGYDKLNSMPNCKSDVCKKECELQELKSSPNKELLKIEEEIAELERDYSSKKQDLQNDTQTTDLHNKQHQQMLEKLESTLTDLELQFTQSEAEKKNLKVKTLMRRSELPTKNIKKNEIEKPKKVKLIPTPTLQRCPPPQLPKKRQPLDSSDSSLDGERLSYAEFMARKKKLKLSSTKLKK